MSEIEFKQLGLFSDCAPSIKPSRESTKWVLYTDGASRRNPGPSGAGIYVLKNNIFSFQKGFFLGKKTNNQAEYLALVLGLYYVKKQISTDDALYIMADSELLIRQMKGMYRVKNADLKKLFDISQALLINIKHSFCHIEREHNVGADAMANHGIDSKKLPPQEFISFLSRHDLQL